MFFIFHDALLNLAFIQTLEYFNTSQLLPSNFYTSLPLETEHAF